MKLIVILIIGAYVANRFTDSTPGAISAYLIGVLAVFVFVLVATLTNNK